jgi:hypothetical protein
MSTATENASFDNNNDNNNEYNNDNITYDDLTMDTIDPTLINMRKLDLEKYMETRKHKTAKCRYCGQTDLYPNGHLSITSKDRISDRSEPPVWFHSECCANMYKHETGICLMPDELFRDIFKRAYPKMYAKRYSV